MIVYEVYLDGMYIDGEYENGLSKDEILDMFYEKVTYPEYVDTFDTKEEAEECAKKCAVTEREDKGVSIDYCYIEEVEYEDEFDDGTTIGIVDYYVQELEPK